jgi:ribosomal protein L9
MAKTQEETLLQRVSRIQQELEYLKRDLFQELGTYSTVQSARKPSLFGSVQGGDITEEMIEEAKYHLFPEHETL